MDRLPEDVLADVLARLAPRALAVSRAVCREWRAVADSRCRLRADLLPVSLGGIFVRTNEPETPAFFVRPSMAHRVAGDLDYYLETDPCQRYLDTPFIVDCCNGLLLLEDHVVNPATRQWVRLPPCPGFPETQGSPGHYNLFLVFDPTSSPHYEVLAMEGPPSYCKDRLPEGRAWPPSVYMLLIYSSSTGRWEERPFVRKGPEITITNNLWPASDLGHTNAVYWHGALYVYWSEFSMRITLSDDTYQVISLPSSFETSKYYHPHLGKSKNGVHFVVVDDQHRLLVWFLDETGGKTEWVLKHGANLQAMKLPTRADRPWILQDGNYDQGSDREPLLEKELDWDSDDNNAVGVEEWDEKHPCLYIEVLGFHPYREIIFFLFINKVVAYYFNSSKVQDLGEIRIKHQYKIIDHAFMYTPCWVGDLSGNS